MYAFKIWFSRLLVFIAESTTLKNIWIPTQYGIDLFTPVQVNRVIWIEKPSIGGL